MRSIFPVILLSLLISACYYPQTTEEYEVGSNFIVSSDSLMLHAGQPLHTPPMFLSPDTAVVYCGASLVVAQMDTIPEDSIDSIWVKVASDQYTQGWIHESELLSSIVPDDPISQFINAFSDNHLWAFGSVLLVALVSWLARRALRRRFPVVHLDDIPSPYPVLLCLTLAGGAVLYASMQHFVPSTWQYFYFHPTLNPFGLPLILGLFLTSVWLMVILLGASLLDIRRCLAPADAVLYTLSLGAWLAVLYVAFNVTTLYYIGYPLWFAYAGWALRRYWLLHRARYVCGRCGANLHDKGICPKCGAENV